MSRIRLGVLTTSVMVLSLQVFNTTNSFAQENPRTSIEHLHSWIFKDKTLTNSGNESCACPECAKSCNHTSEAADFGGNENLDMLGFIDEFTVCESDEVTVFPKCCDGDDCEDCSLCLENLDIGSEKPEYCMEMAKLVRSALNGKELDDSAALKTIESAMILVARNAQAESKTEMAQLVAKHTEERALMRGQLVQMSTQTRTVNDLRSWLGPLYTNQNRTLQQIQLMSASSNALTRTLNLLEKQLSSNRPAAPTNVKYANPHVNRASAEPVVYDLRRQVSQLKQQLQQLQQTHQVQSEKVQPAQHLQPIYKSTNQLEPLDTPFPATIDFFPKSRRR